MTRLEQCFGIPRPVSPGDVSFHPDLLDELVGAILSQNTTVRVSGAEPFHNRSRAFRALKAAYPHWEQVLTADPEALALILRPGGLANLKAARIQELLAEIQDRQGSLQLNFLAELDTEQALDYLLSLKGVGLKTATCVLLFGLGRDLCPVDTHVHRVANRLGLVRAKAPDDTFVQLSSHIPVGKAYSLHINLIRLGKRICKARMPECGRCPLRRECPSALLRQR
ncbi:endonuclease III [Synechococcus bigranulatus str. 'Rupite']|uniref:Endonuclease III n=1 Tax=Thermostichus vulcanus str. 'Rupite' TaxID=2813851 RepID=A0ABT0CA91_THEVL|nr:endonuclease III [Thermostichus vulcanus str. 'Rupite']